MKQYEINKVIKKAKAISKIDVKGMYKLVQGLASKWIKDLKDK